MSYSDEELKLIEIIRCKVRESSPGLSQWTGDTNHDELFEKQLQQTVSMLVERIDKGLKERMIALTPPSMEDVRAEVHQMIVDLGLEKEVAAFPIEVIKLNEIEFTPTLPCGECHDPIDDDPEFMDGYLCECGKVVCESCIVFGREPNAVDLCKACAARGEES